MKALAWRRSKLWPAEHPWSRPIFPRWWKPWGRRAAGEPRQRVRYSAGLARGSAGWKSAQPALPGGPRPGRTLSMGANSQRSTGHLSGNYIHLIFNLADYRNSSTITRDVLCFEVNVGEDGHMDWTRSETLALALHNCAHCHGAGLRLTRKGLFMPCNCVLRSIFRICWDRFVRCATQERSVSRVSLEPHVGRSRPSTWGRKDEEYHGGFPVNRPPQSGRFRKSSVSLSLPAGRRIGSCARANWKWTGAISIMPCTASSRSWAARFAKPGRIRCFPSTNISMDPPASARRACPRKWRQ